MCWSDTPSLQAAAAPAAAAPAAPAAAAASFGRGMPVGPAGGSLVAC
jgi:hypothetical protein